MKNISKNSYKEIKRTYVEIVENISCIASSARAFSSLLAAGVNGLPNGLHPGASQESFTITKYHVTVICLELMVTEPSRLNFGLLKSRPLAVVDLPSSNN